MAPTIAIIAEANKILYKLSDFDLELIKCLCLPDKLNSEKFGISRGAISMQITRISVKLGVENRTAVVVRALMLKLITIDQLVFRSYNGKANTS